MRKLNFEITTAVLVAIIIGLSGCITLRLNPTFDLDRAISIGTLALRLAELEGWEEAATIREYLEALEKTKQGDPETILNIIEIVLEKIDEPKLIEFFNDYREELKGIIERRNELKA